MAKRRFKLINAPVSVLEINDLTAAVTWANVPDVNITESSVLQHQSALTILESQITDGSILARIAANETITGAYTFTNGVTLTGGNLVAGTIDADFDELSVTNVQFDLNFTNGTAEGRLQWNIEDGTLEVGMPGGVVNLQIGQETMIRVRNTTGALIADGSPVYITGASGNKPLIALADATNLATSDVLGIATEDIANNDNGFVTLSGLVRDVNTAGMTEGDKLWLSETAGAFTTTQPSSPAQKVRVGHVLAVSATVGTIHVALTPGIELSHISDSGLNNDLLHRVANVWVPSAGALTFDGTDLVCGGDISGLTIGGIPEANLLDRTVNEIVTGRWDFESDGSAPQLCIVDSDSNGAATRAFIEYLGKNDVLTGRMGYLTATSGIFTIDNALPNAGIELTNAGVQKLRIDINGVFMSDDTDISGALTATSYDGVLAANLLDKIADATISGAYTFTAIPIVSMSGAAEFAIKQTDGAVDEKRWGLRAATNTLSFMTRSDSNSFGVNFITFTRNGVLVDGVNVAAPFTATSYNGVLAANLLDKTAVETISGDYNFTAPTLQKTGGTVFITDAGNTDWLAQAHNGTDYNFTFVNTTNWNVTGAKLLTAASTTTKAGFHVPEGTAPSSPVDGDMWVTPTNIFARVNGVNESLLGAGGVPAAASKRKTADTVKTTDVVLANDPHLVGFSLDADSYYKITGYLIIKVAASTIPDFQFTFNLSQTLQTSRNTYTAVSDSSVVVSDTIVITTGTTIQMASNARTGLTFHAFIRTNASLSSTANFRWAQAGSSGFSTTLEEGSWITFEKIT